MMVVYVSHGAVLCVQAIFTGYSPEEIMASMVECTLQEEEALNHLTAAINLQRDAAELKYVC